MPALCSNGERECAHMLRMSSLEIQGKIRKKLYRYRFLCRYIVIGFFSIVLELALLRVLHLYTPALMAQCLAVMTGILFAFIVNVKFNFKVPEAKRSSAFLWFAAISCGSYFLNLSVRNYMVKWTLSYESSRLLTSAILFFLAYLLHRRFSFWNYKKVGVAIYAETGNDIRDIWEKVQEVCDFIHVDLVDRSFNPEASPVDVGQLETIRSYWPRQPLECHLMSRTPSCWLDAVMKYSDTVIVHYEIDEDLKSILRRIRAGGRKAGLSIVTSTPVSTLEDFIPFVDEVMLLGIARPGSSGQEFDTTTPERIAEFDRLKNRRSVVLCVDGGISSLTISRLQVEKVVSASYILNGNDPIRRICKLQTSCQYESN